MQIWGGKSRGLSPLQAQTLQLPCSGLQKWTEKSRGLRFCDFPASLADRSREIARPETCLQAGREIPRSETCRSGQASISAFDTSPRLQANSKGLDLCFDTSLRNSTQKPEFNFKKPSKGQPRCKPTQKVSTSALTHLSGSLHTSKPELKAMNHRWHLESSSKSLEKGSLDCKPTQKASASALTHLSGSLHTSEARIEGDESSMAPGINKKSLQKGSLDCKPTQKASTSALTHLSGSLHTSEARIEGDESSMAPGINFKKPLKGQPRLQANSKGLGLCFDTSLRKSSHFRSPN